MPIPLIAGLGRRDDLEAELEQLGITQDHIIARVMAQHRDGWLVAAEQAPGWAPWLAPARGRLRDDPGGPPVTGDWVALDPAGAIVAVLERRGAIVRRAAQTTTPQVLAANVDLALLVEPLPEPGLGRAERFVAMARAGGVEPLLVLTKADLDPEPWTTAAHAARRLGLAESLTVSVVDGDGLDALRSRLEPGRTAVLLGASGAGKSTLVNALLGHERQATAPVRASDGRGRHTTVTRELLRLPGGALLIDTPGVREAGVWDDVGGAFDDVERLSAACRFGDCSHQDEPGCAVREGIEPERLAAWRKLVLEEAWVADRRAMAREREARGRTYRTIQRDARRLKGQDDH